MSENAAAGSSTGGTRSPAVPPTNGDSAPGDGKQPTVARRARGTGLVRNLGLVIALIVLAALLRADRRARHPDGT